MLCPICFSRSTAALTCAVTPGRSNPATCGFPESSAFCASSSVLPWARANSAFAVSPVTLIRDDAGAGERGVERHRHELARVRRRRAGDDDHRLRAVLARGRRLVAEIGVARENPLRLRLGVLRKISQDEDDLVLDVQAGVAVVAEILTVGDDESVAGEHHRTARPRRCRRTTGARAVATTPPSTPRGRCVAQTDLRAAVLGAGRELERHAVVRLSRDRFGADLLRAARRCSRPRGVRRRIRSIVRRACRTRASARVAASRKARRADPVKSASRRCRDVCADAESWRRRRSRGTGGAS